jgi:polar amino acid transport system substrate-binding protein
MNAASHKLNLGMSWRQLLVILGLMIVCWSSAAATSLPDNSARSTSTLTSLDTGLRASERLVQIKRRSTLLVGIKTDYPPFGMISGNGVPQGFEHDLAEDIATRLGVTLTKVPVTGANRLQKLEEGAIDIVIATQGDTAERRKIATQIEPNYYASGATLLVRPESQLRDWSDVRGKQVCATQGSYFNREMSSRYLLNLQTYNNARDAKLAVRDKRCIGFLFDNTALASDIKQPEWADYKIPLSVSLVTPWAIAIGRNESGTDFEAFLGDIVADWHRSGFLIERERAWDISPSKFLQDMHDLWTKTDVSGQLVCRRIPGTGITPECRNRVFVSAVDVSGLHRLGLQFKEATGLDLSILYDTYDRSAFGSGLLVTLLLTLLCVCGSLAFGVLAALVAEHRTYHLRTVISIIGTWSRMTPPLLQIYLVLLGFGSILSATIGINLNPMLVVVICLSCYAGASILVALDEAALVVRKSDPDYRITLLGFYKIVPYAQGPVLAALVNISKATMIGSAVAVPELLNAATSIVADRGNVGVVMTALLLTFLVLIYVVVRLLEALGRLAVRRVSH